MLAPIVLFVYNRVEHVKKVIEHLGACEMASSSVLYIISDGAKKEDEEKVAEVRKYIKTIIGFADVIVEERENNYGIEKSEIEAITRLINKYDKLIILEDDLVVGKYFLEYMNKALDKYEDNKEVFYISGYMYENIRSNIPDTVFSKLPSTWGWATWKDRWDRFQMPPEHPETIYNNKELLYKYCYDNSYADFGAMLKTQALETKYTWDICWYVSMFYNNGLVLLPKNTLVANIGFDGSGVHGDDAGYGGKVKNIDFKVMSYPDAIEENPKHRKILARNIRKWSLKRRIKAKIIRGWNRCILRK